MFLFAAAAVVLGFFITGCLTTSHEGVYKIEKSISETEVLKIAREKAKSKGIDPSLYKATAWQMDSKWQVLFNRNERSFGWPIYFIVIVLPDKKAELSIGY